MHRAVRAPLRLGAGKGKLIAVIRLRKAQGRAAAWKVLAGALRTTHLGRSGGLGTILRWYYAHSGIEVRVHACLLPSDVMQGLDSELAGCDALLVTFRGLSKRQLCSRPWVGDFQYRNV